MITPLVRTGIVTAFVAAATLCPGRAAMAGAAAAAGADATASLLPADAFAPSFIGVYRKVMEIDDDIRTFAARYNVDVSLARAVCMYESGGNANLTSGAGARGYFQVMPATFRLMRVSSNIEAGVKYLGQLVAQFGREDYALAAYNGGPGRVARGSAMPLESLQYVLGVGAYRTALEMYEPSVRAAAGDLDLAASQPGDSWWALSNRLHVPLIQLRLYNPFITDGRLQRGTYTIAYPRHPAGAFFEVNDEGDLEYRSRIGDNYINLAVAFGVDLDELRSVNRLWRLQQLPTGMELTIPIDAPEELVADRVRDGEDLLAVAARLRTNPWQLIRDNQLWDQQVHAGMIVRAPGPSRAARPEVARTPPPAPPRPSFATHRVSKGDNLTTIARRYGTTVEAIQRINGMGRRTAIRVGQRLRIPLN
jgi:LysM repeat protein